MLLGCCFRLLLQVATVQGSCQLSSLISGDGGSDHPVNFFETNLQNGKDRNCFDGDKKVAYITWLAGVMLNMANKED